MMERRDLPEGRVRVGRDPDWAGLVRASGVLVLSTQSLANALMAGVERIWWLPFALDLVEANAFKESIIASCVLATREELAGSC